MHLSERTPSPVRHVPFGTLPDGSAVSLFTLESPGGLRVSITDFGGTVTALFAPDRQGIAADVVLGCDSLEACLAANSFLGSTIGRFGNRIALGRFELDGESLTLPQNNGPHHLHGGPEGFDRRLWQAQIDADSIFPSLRLSRTSPDGEQGYPGNLHVQVTFSLTDPDTLRIDYHAETDQATPVNLTNHAYFNLAGHQNGSIIDHEMQIMASRFTPVDETLIPTGEIHPVAGTPLDFTTPCPIGARIGFPDDQLRFGQGYDHNYVLDRDGEGSLFLAARVREPDSGRVLEVLTTEPGIQFYSGNFLDGFIIGKDGVRYVKRSGFCLETQHYPDSPNQPAFPSTILRAGGVYRSTTLYRFTAE